MVDGNNLYQKSCAFALRVVQLYQFLNSEKKEFILSRQLLRSGTSIGANVAEANGGISTADFSAKISIAYKESLETKYWIGLLRDAGYLPEKDCNPLLEDADELSRILFSILKQTRINSSK
ncbi:MAG: four helix bundle protein [Adhaeribacter sp.]